MRQGGVSAMVGVRGMSGGSEGRAAARFGREAHRWDRIYRDDGGLVERLWDRATRRNVRERFVRTFDLAGDLEGASVLDLGCGSGRYLVEAVERGAARVVGVDAAPAMIRVARALADAHPRGDRVALHATEFRRFEPDGRFDLVIANGVFDYVDDALGLLSLAAAAARAPTTTTAAPTPQTPTTPTRSLVVATFPARDAPRAFPRWLYWRARGLRIRLFDRGTIAALAERAGLGGPDLRIERIGPIFLLAARRARP